MLFKICYIVILTMKNKIETLICSGGGVKGISYIGVLKALKEIKNEKDDLFDIKTVCGVSIGSLFGLLYILDYDAIELEQEILQLDFLKFFNIKLENLINKYGIDSGKRITNWIGNILKKKNIKKDITFDELYKLKNVHFKVFVTNLNTYKLTIFDHINTPKLKIIKAIRMSMSLPLIFTAEKYKDQIYVDGALVDNYPIHYYENNLDSVLGIKLLSHKNEHDDNNGNKNCSINGFDDFLLHSISCYMLQKDKYNLIKNNYKDHTIFIYSDGIKGLNFGISKEQKIKMVNAGHEYTKRFFIEKEKNVKYEIT